MESIPQIPLSSLTGYFEPVDEWPISFSMSKLMTPSPPLIRFDTEKRVLS
mgnify:CR=1 FL=1|jgi:hypothetical protein